MGKRLEALTRKLSANRLILVIFIIVFGGVGGWFLVTSHAATPTASVEPENGLLASGASTVHDSTASGSDAVKFGITVTVPAQCANGGSYLWNNLETCGWPGPSNTGVDMSQCPGGLTNSSSLTITTADTVVSCKNISGGIDVEAQNVTIKNSVVSRNAAGAGGTGVIEIGDGASATVDRVEINGQDATHACIFNSGSKGATLQYSLVAKNVKCHDVNDGIFSWWWDQRTSYGGGSYFDTNADAGSNFIIQDSYFYDFTEGAANGHIDGYQTEGAWNGTITHNTYHMNRRAGDTDVDGGDMDSAIAIWNDFNSYKVAADGGTDKTVDNFTISNNLFAGGGFTVYAEDRSPGGGAPSESSPVGGHEMTNIKVLNNKFSTYLEGGCVGEYGVWFYRGPLTNNPNLTWPPYNGGPTGDWGANGNIRSGNVVLETGENIDSDNPHEGSYLCH